MVCRIQHPGVIEFLAVHEWKHRHFGGTGIVSKKILLKENTKVSEAIENRHIFKPPVNQPIETLQRIYAFRTHTTELA